MLASDVSGARLEPGEKRGKATHWNQPVHGGDGKEQEAEKSRDQRQAHSDVRRIAQPGEVPGDFRNARNHLA